MALDNAATIDAVGLDATSGKVILAIVDSWDWLDESRHLLALQAKLNAYFDFIEFGQLLENYPDAAGRNVIIDVVGRHPLPFVAWELLQSARDMVGDLGVEVRYRFIPEQLEKGGSFHVI